MTTWTLVIFLLTEPTIIHGFASKESCEKAAVAIGEAQGRGRGDKRACVEVKPTPCGGYQGYTITPLN